MLVSYKRYFMPGVVFITGAAVLVIEVIALRILAPYFGNTIFSASSVVSVVLAALSAGYYIGGRFADKNPSYKIFFSIILAGGVAVLCMQVANLFVLPLIGYQLPLRSGPLVVATLLFFIPSLLLGMLSPFAIALQKRVVPDAGVGTLSGTIFLWSTLGSIAGSLATGFFLIPHFGTDIIVSITGGALLIVGGIPLIFLGKSRNQIIKIIIVVAGSACATTIAMQPIPNEKFLYAHDGIYQKTFIYDTVFKGQPVRFFQLDRWIEGGMYLNSIEQVFSYTQYFQIYKLFGLEPRRVLVIGGASYTIPKAYLMADQKISVDVVEIEPSYPELAEKFFDAHPSPRLNSIIADGRRFLNETTETYDIIYSDVYSSVISIPAHFTTQEFFQTAKNKLSKNGIFLANIIGSLRQDNDSLLLSEIKTFRSVFPHSYFFAVNAADSHDVQNIIFVGLNGDTTTSLSELIAKTSEPFLHSLSRNVISLETIDISRYPTLTDNFAPIEYLTAKLIQK